MRILLAFLCCVSTAYAAGTPNSAISPQTPNRGIAQITNATGALTIANNGASATNAVTLYTCETTAGAVSKIVSLVCGTNDTVANVIEVMLVNASKVYFLGSVSVPAASASSVTGVAGPINFFATTNMPGLPTDNDGNPYIQCVSGDTIQIGVWTTAVATNKVATCIAQAFDY